MNLEIIRIFIDSNIKIPKKLQNFYTVNQHLLLCEPEDFYDLKIPVCDDILDKIMKLPFIDKLNLINVYSNLDSILETSKFYKISFEKCSTPEILKW